MRSTAAKTASGPSRDVGLLVPGRQQVPGEVGQGDEQLVGRDVDAEHVARLPAQAQAPRGPAAGRRPEPVGGDEADRLQLADPLGHDAPAEADAVGQRGWVMPGVARMASRTAASPVKRSLGTATPPSSTDRERRTGDRKA